MKIKPIYLVLILVLGAVIGYIASTYFISPKFGSRIATQTTSSESLKYTNDMFNFSILFSPDTQQYLNNMENITQVMIIHTTQSRQ
jgi:hypothetical protein